MFCILFRNWSKILTYKTVFSLVICQHIPSSQYHLILEGLFWKMKGKKRRENSVNTKYKSIPFSTANVPRAWLWRHVQNMTSDVFGPSWVLCERWNVFLYTPITTTYTIFRKPLSDLFFLGNRTIWPRGEKYQNFSFPVGVVNFCSLAFLRQTTGRTFVISIWHEQLVSCSMVAWGSCPCPKTWKLMSYRGAENFLM